MKTNTVSLIAAGMICLVPTYSSSQAPQQQQLQQQQLQAPNAAAGNLRGQAGPETQVPPKLPEFVRDENAELAKDKPLIQIALLLDTSSSMNGLINQAKERLWAIVNEFIEAKREGEDPIFQVALYEYGKKSLEAEDAWVRKIVPLTIDLDKVSEELFALNTSGGEEYCGWVIGRSLLELGWSDKKDDLRVIFIAGNEPFTQGPVDAVAQCGDAKRADIVVNTIHCGPHDKGISGGWKSGADEGGGAYMSIDQNQVLAHIDAPQDEALAKLNTDLNGTYVAFGRGGAAAKERQAVQDQNALAIGADAFSGRAATKSGKFYSNARWDLCDWCAVEGNDLATLKEEDLPEEVRKLDAEGRKAYVAEMTAKRAEISNEIKRLAAERASFVAEARKKQAEESGEKSLDEAVIESLKAEAKKRGFTLGKKG